MLIVILFKNCRQPSTGEWINKPCYVYKMKDLTIDTDKNMAQSQIIILSEKKKKPEKEATYFIIIFI